MSQQVVTYAWNNDTDTAGPVFRCTWACRSVSAVGHGLDYFSVDLIVEANPHQSFHGAGSDARGNIQNDKHSALSAICQEMSHHSQIKSDFTAAVTILLPAFPGYFLQANIIQDRFADSAVISKALRLIDGHAKASAPSSQVLSSGSLANLLEFAVAALISYETEFLSGGTKQAQDRIDEDIKHRLRLDWWQAELPPPKRLALVDAGPNWNYFGPVYEAARANRISLVVIEEPGNFLTEPSNSKFCDHFLPLSLQNSDGRLGERIAEVLKKSGIVVDGITATSDDVLLPTAQAATILGLPTQPPASFALCRDKHAASRLRPSPIQSFEVATMEQAMSLSADPSVRYPLIAKPNSGKSSYGVAKVTDQSDIVRAVSAILSEFDDTVVIETYIDGPELDVNLVLCYGELLFCEILDDFPSEGDEENANSSASFLESALSSPSALPPAELAMAQASALQSVLAAGFYSGVFHVEGRVANSSMRYKRTEYGMELQPSTSGEPQQEAQFALIEINARPPGTLSSVATKLTYGIDYYEQWLFTALQDYNRMTTSARPFSFPRFSAGAQYWSHNLIFPTTKGGKFDSRIWKSMLAQHSDIMQHVSAFSSPFSDGDNVPDPMTGRKRILAWFIICTREENRRRALEIALELQNELGGVLADGLVSQEEGESG